MRIATSALLAIVLLASPAAARPLSLGEAVSLAVERHPALAGARHRVAAADAELQRERGKRDVTMEASVGASRADPPEATEPPEATDPPEATVSATGGVIAPLPSGGSLAVRSGASATRHLAVEHGAHLGAELTQPLLRGAGSFGAYGGEHRARALKTAEERAAEAAASDALHEVIVAYLRLAGAREERAVLARALSAFEKQLAATEALVRVGRMPPTAVAAPRSQVSAAKASLAAARAEVVARASDLGALLGLAEPAALETPAPPPITGAPPSLEAALAAALAESPALAAARARSDAARVAVRVAEQDRLPALDLSVGAGLLGRGASPGASLRSLVNADGFEAHAALTLSAPLGNDAAIGAHRLARAERSSRALEAASIRAAVEAAVTRALSAARSAGERLDALEQAVADAARSVRDAEALFRAGRGSSFEVLYRQEALLGLELRRSRARIDAWLARADLDRVTGALLRRHGVTL